MVKESEFVMFSNNDDIIAQSFFWFGAEGYEPFSVGLFRELSKNCSVIFDIGAFTGLYSLCAASVNNRAAIVTFEPSRSTWERAKVNFVANSYGSTIDLRNIALGAEVGTIEFNHYRSPLVLQAGASYVRKGGKEIFSTEIVSVGIGDEVVSSLGGLDLVKLDVEGAELSVLKGMKSSISSYEPIFIIEIEPTNFRDVLVFFEEMGYVLKYIDEEHSQFLDCDAGADKVANFCAVSKTKIDLVPGFVL